MELQAPAKQETLVTFPKAHRKAIYGQILRADAEGLVHQAIAGRFGISRSMVSRIVRRYKPKEERMTTLRAIDQMQAEIDRLRAEVAAAWIEATAGWACCASIHRQYARGKDALYRTRQADFIKHEERARAKTAKEGE
jgi:predicted transcriptional regulator